MGYLDYDLSRADEAWCKRWLRSYSFVIASLTNKDDFTEYSLGKLIVYEVGHEQRVDLLHRMTARHAKLRRQREWQELLQLIARLKEVRNAKKRLRK